MPILNRSFNTDCMLVPKMKLSLHWVTVKSSCENSCWSQDFTFGLIIEHILENYLQYAILLVVLSERECYVWDLPLMARNVLFCIWCIQLLTWFELYILQFTNEESILSLPRYEFGMSSTVFEGTGGYWNNPEHFSCIHSFLVSVFHVWF